jgi:hypothetical protein
MFEKKYRDLVNVCMYGMIGSKENKAIILFLVIALGTCAIYWSTSHWRPRDHFLRSPCLYGQFFAGLGRLSQRS